MSTESPIPSSLREAYRFLNKDRAWVGCLVGDGEIHVIASEATTQELARNRVTAPYLSPDCPKLERASFLMGGLHDLERRLVG